MAASPKLRSTHFRIRKRLAISFSCAHAHVVYKMDDIVTTSVSLSLSDFVASCSRKLISSSR